MLARTYLKRGAANAWLSQFDAAVADYKQAIEYPAVFGKEQIEKMQRDCDMI